VKEEAKTVAPDQTAGEGIVTCMAAVATIGVNELSLQPLVPASPVL
jgi:hypothetical protein